MYVCVCSRESFSCNNHAYTYASWKCRYVRTYVNMQFYCTVWNLIYTDDGDDNSTTAVIIGAVIGGCAVIVVMAMLIITVVCFKQKSKTKKKCVARHDSFNDYSDRPKRTRYYQIHTYVYNYVSCTEYTLCDRLCKNPPCLCILCIFT